MTKSPLFAPPPDGLLNAIVESSDEAIISKDLDGIITSWNKAAERIYGYTAAEVLGKPVAILIPDDRADEEPAILDRVHKGERIEHYHTVLRRKDGSTIDVSLTVSPVKDGDGEIVGASMIARDITTERSTQLLANRFASIVANSDDAIISKNLDGIIESWNQGAERIFGYKRVEAIGKSIMMVIPPDRRSEEADILAQIRSGKRIDHFETVRMKKDGTLIDVSVSISPIKNADGDIIGASKILRDITDRKKADAGLREARLRLQEHAAQLEATVADRTTQLRQTVSELQAFSYSLSHDLRAPIRTIQSFSQIILEDERDRLSPEAVEHLGRVVRAADRMDRLIRDVLTFTRLSREELIYERVDVEKLIRDITSERPDWQPPNADIEIESPLLPVRGHQAFVTQCLTNLLDNAMKFVPPGVTPRITIRSEPVEDCVRISFEDNGIGIATEMQGKLFGMFQRTHTGSQYPGFGIGLAIVRRAVERMDGKVGVESELGRGSRFWISLPRADS